MSTSWFVKKGPFFSLLLHLPVCKFPLGRETCNSQQFRANKWTDERLNKHTGINRNRECYKHVWKSVVQSDEVSWLSDHNTETGTSTACWSLQVFIRSACVGAGTVWHAFLFHVLLKKCLRRRPLHKLFSHIDQFVNHLMTENLLWPPVKVPLRMSLTCSFAVFFMRGHSVTTCWWHRLWTTQVHTGKTTTVSYLRVYV